MFEGETGVVCGAHLGGRDLVRGYGRAHARPGRRGDVDVTNTSNLGGREDGETGHGMKFCTRRAV